MVRRRMMGMVGAVATLALLGTLAGASASKTKGLKAGCACCGDSCACAVCCDSTGGCACCGDSCSCLVCCDGMAKAAGKASVHGTCCDVKSETSTR